MAIKSKFVRGNGSADLGRFIGAIADGLIPVKGANVKPADPEKPEFKFHEATPPKWWDREAGIMDITYIRNRTGLERTDLVRMGFSCTKKQARAPWPAYGPTMPEWWYDVDDDLGPPAKAAPKGEIARLKLEIHGGTILPPTAEHMRNLARNADK